MSELRNAPDEFQHFKSEHRSLAVLRVLHREPSHKSNDQIILDWLRKLALVSTREELKATIEKLAVLSLINTETIDDITVFELTEKGEDVALGRSIIEGVLRPSPDCPY